MSNKKITAFQNNDNPTLSDVFPIVNNDETKQMSLSGLTKFVDSILNVKHWLENETRVLDSKDTIVISGDYVLENSNLELKNDTPIIIGGLTFNKYSQIFIGGNLLLKDSNIINDGLINVAGAVILNGNSTITGTGILI